MNEKISVWMKVALALGVVIVAVVIAVVALSDSDDDDDVGEVANAEEPAEIPDDAEDLTGQATVEISVTDNIFTPGAVVVSPGTEIVWTNEGINDHNVKPDDPGAFEAVETDELGRDTPVGRSFDDPGSFPYYCSVHGAPGLGQFGTIIVS